MSCIMQATQLDEKNTTVRYWSKIEFYLSGRLKSVLSDLLRILWGRSPEDADAQALRAAIILDELDFPGWGVPDFR
jgi:hypothetical protein